MKVNGIAVKAIRTAQGRSLRDVAKAASLDPGYLSRVENGEKGAEEPTIERLAGALDTDPRAISYPDEPVIQCTPETFHKLADYLSSRFAVVAE